MITGCRILLFLSVALSSLYLHDLVVRLAYTLHTLHSLTPLVGFHRVYCCVVVFFLCLTVVVVVYDGFLLIIWWFVGDISSKNAICSSFFCSYCWTFEFGLYKEYDNSANAYTFGDWCTEFYRLVTGEGSERVSMFLKTTSILSVLKVRKYIYVFHRVR